MQKVSVHMQWVINRSVNWSPDCESSKSSGKMGVFNLIVSDLYSNNREAQMRHFI